MIVRELITKLGFSVDDAGMRKAEEGISRIKKQADFAAQAMVGVGASLAGAAWAKSAIAIADEMQNIRTRIGQLPQTVGDAGDAFDEVAKRASAAGVKINAYASLYTRVGNAAKDYITTQEDLLGITDTISQALAVGGASAQEASSVMLQFSQALASGVLQGQEFQAMAEAADQYMTQLALAMGKPREQLKKMASDGKLTAREVIEATRKMADYFDVKFRQIPVTVGRAMTVIENRFALMLDNMNRDSNFVTTIANAFLSAFDKIEAGVYKLEEVLGGWDQILKLIGVGLASLFGATAILLIKAFGIAVLSVITPFIILAAKIALVILVLEDLWVWFKGGDSVIGAFIGNWEDVKYTVLGVATAIGAVVGMFGVWKAAVIGYTLAMQAYKAAIIAVTAVKRGLIVVAFAFNAVMALNPIGLIVIAIGALIAAGALLIANWQTVKDWFAGLFSWFGDKFTELGKWVADLLTKAGSLFGVGGATAGAAGPGATPANAVTPARLAAMSSARPSLVNTTNVNVTVPSGTTAEQVLVLNGAANKAFRETSDRKFARDAAIYAR